MKTKHLLGSVVCWMLLAAASTACLAEDAVTLALAYKKGDVIRHKVTINTSIMGMDVTVTSTSKTTVQEVKDNGEVVSVEEAEETRISIGGMEIDQPGQPPVTTTRDKYGKLVDYKREETPQAFLAPEIERMSAMISGALLPDKAVKAGDTWQVELENPAVKGKKVVVKGTFIGMEKVDDAELWKIKQTAEADTDADGGKMTQEFIAWLAPSNGQVVKMEGSVKDLPTVQFGPISWTIKMELIKEEKKESE